MRPTSPVLSELGESNLPRLRDERAWERDREELENLQEKYVPGEGVRISATDPTVPKKEYRK